MASPAAVALASSGVAYIGNSTVFSTPSAPTSPVINDNWIGSLSIALILF
jgi:hypothetical protein